MSRIFLHIILILCAIFILDSCASVPRESALLSIELTSMIRSAKVAHLSLLNQYIIQRRERINEFMERVWTPKFMENALKDTKIIELINMAKDNKEKGELFKEFEEDANVQISKRRSALIDAVDDIRNTLQEAITNHYDQMLAVNQALTSHLQSAAEIGEIRDKLISALNVEPNKLLPMDKIDNVMNSVLTYQSKTEDILNTANQIRTIIKEK